jgi:hypothetical protein
MIDVPPLTEAVRLRTGERSRVMSLDEWRRFPITPESIRAYREAIRADRNATCPVGDDCEECDSVAESALFHWAVSWDERQKICEAIVD